jgi:hypothetical protein
MNRIASFKNSPLVEVEIKTIKTLFERNARSTGKNGRGNVTEVRDSLVGATQNLNGGKTTYTYSNGRTCRHPDGPFHSCEYVDQRNRLIPTAIMNSGRVVFVGGDPTGTKRAAEFLKEMTRLWSERK